MGGNIIPFFLQTTSSLSFKSRYCRPYAFTHKLSIILGTENNEMKNRGFSLLELLIAMMIISILLLAATPVYTSFLTKSYRSQAIADLMHLTSQMEYFYSLHATYVEASLAQLQIAEFTENHTYQLLIESATETSYLVTATPLGVQAKLDRNCGKLLLDERGTQSVTGAQAPEKCWRLW